MTRRAFWSLFWLYTVARGQAFKVRCVVASLDLDFKAVGVAHVSPLDEAGPGARVEPLTSKRVPAIMILFGSSALSPAHAATSDSAAAAWLCKKRKRPCALSNRSAGIALKLGLQGVEPRGDEARVDAMLKVAGAVANAAADCRLQNPASRAR